MISDKRDQILIHGKKAPFSSSYGWEPKRSKKLQTEKANVKSEKKRQHRQIQTMPIARTVFSTQQYLENVKSRHTSRSQTRDRDATKKPTPYSHIVKNTHNRK